MKKSISTFMIFSCLNLVLLSSNATAQEEYAYPPDFVGPIQEQESSNLDPCIEPLLRDCYAVALSAMVCIYCLDQSGAYENVECAFDDVAKQMEEATRIVP